MRTTLLRLGLALFVLARGPLCGLVCDLPIAEAAPATAHHGPASPCHGSEAGEAPAQPEAPHDSCAGCDTTLLTASDGPTSGALSGMHAAAVTVTGHESQALARAGAVRVQPAVQPPPADVLLLKATLLL